ncbi:hypothetical protein M595_0339 [Lyngbya aestuarii BL J]|uniref:Uncharacterized protein n=1 Tax=Lyngbya aestuarii BL J TaxID=1348334 RepID=U7QQU1_9CYAN|nr:hypothetical protein M595_0339 [Lyngbya aestuarii BL J]
MLWVLWFHFPNRENVLSPVEISLKTILNICEPEENPLV